MSLEPVEASDWYNLVEVASVFVLPRRQRLSSQSSFSSLFELAVSMTKISGSSMYWPIMSGLTIKYQTSSSFEDQKQWMTCTDRPNTCGLEVIPSQVENAEIFILSHCPSLEISQD